MPKRKSYQKEHAFRNVCRRIYSNSLEISWNSSSSEDGENDNFIIKKCRKNADEDLNFDKFKNFAQLCNLNTEKANVSPILTINVSSSPSKNHQANSGHISTESPTNKSIINPVESPILSLSTSCTEMSPVLLSTYILRDKINKCEENISDKSDSPDLFESKLSQLIVTEQSPIKSQSLSKSYNQIESVLSQDSSNINIVESETSSNNYSNVSSIIKRKYKKGSLALQLKRALHLEKMNFSLQDESSNCINTNLLDNAVVYVYIKKLYNKFGCSVVEGVVYNSATKSTSAEKVIIILGCQFDVIKILPENILQIFSPYKLEMIEYENTKIKSYYGIHNVKIYCK